MNLVNRIAIAVVLSIAVAVAAIAFQQQTLTLDNPSDYGNLILVLQEAQAGTSADTYVGTKEAGVIHVVANPR